MQPAPIPADEQQRLEALKALGILDTKPDERFDAITKEAAARLRVPISTVSLIDADREWYLSCQGLDIKEAKRETSFCGHALFSKNIFIVEDTLKDPRFADNPTVTGKPYIRFYAGVALYDNFYRLPIGVLCVKDTKPRSMSAEAAGILLELAAKAETEIHA